MMMNRGKAPELRHNVDVHPRSFPDTFYAIFRPEPGGFASLRGCVKDKWSNEKLNTSEIIVSDANVWYSIYEIVRGFRSNELW